MVSYWSPSSAVVVAEVAQVMPSSRATRAPAMACWSTSITSGANSSTAARTPGTIECASGIRKSSQKKRNAVAERSPRQRSSREASGSPGNSASIPKTRRPGGSTPPR